MQLSIRLKLPAVCFVMRNKIFLQDFNDEFARAFAEILCALLDWENSHGDIFRNGSMRELYFGLISTHFLISHRQSSLKKSFYTGKFSERTMRNTIRHYERLGLIKKAYSRVDFRTTQLLPEEALIRLFDEHIREISRLLQNHFFLIRK